MKKSLLAVAVAAALPAFAHAQTSVTLYGIADGGVNYVDRGTDAAGNKRSAFTVDSGVQSTSRWGIRGTEDLGGGLSAVFNLEAGYKQDTGTGTSAGNTTMDFQRRSVVGLSGGFGTVLLGRDYTAGFTSAGTTDIFGYGLYGNWLTFSVQGSTTYASSVVGQPLLVRANGIHYVSPNLGGVTLRAFYSPGERDLTPKSIGNIWGLSGVYAAGPLTVQGYYMALKVGTPITVTGGAAAQGTADTDNEKQYGIGAAYAFGPAKITLNYGQVDPPGADTATLGKTRAVQLGGSIAVGPGTIMAGITNMRTTLAGTTPKANAFGLAYVQPLSKRTNIYATFGLTRNNADGNFILRSSDNTYTPAAAGEDPKAFALGVRHTF